MSTPKLTEYRLHIPLSLCVSIAAPSYEAAEAELRRVLSGSSIETGIDIEDHLFNREDVSRSLDARLYANEPFEGIECADELEVEDQK